MCTLLNAYARRIIAIEPFCCKSEISSMSYSGWADLLKNSASASITAATVHNTTNSGPKHSPKFNVFYALSITSIIACLLVAANELEWRRSGDFYLLVTTNRASVQIIQVLANLFGLIHVTAFCRLINYTTRIRFSKTVISLDTLQAWIALSTARIDWNLPICQRLNGYQLNHMYNLPSSLQLMAARC